ncbi:hypothetical protein [Microlunatus soli]|uniref:DUF1453 domain-containing protein n=1 Tax=Microlunatus soli TaxID=630515 RepID=A0A1H1VQH9_9ACTN|nr:hypothetical protein [Microlunatus soli]SDS86750.1 hypothetical protein SAMN04489812_3300 [Microlunatus soli]
MDNALLLVVAIAAIGFVIIRRFMGTPLVAKDVFLAPLLFLGIGLWSIRKVAHWEVIDASMLAIGLVAGLIFGGIRGTTTLIYTRDGLLHQRYRPSTLLVWGLGLAVSGGLYVIGHQFGAGEHSHSPMLSLGVSLLGEMVTCGVRALSTGKPFSPPKDGREYDGLVQTLNKIKAPESPGTLTESPTFRQAVDTLVTHHRRDSTVAPK